MPPRPIPLEELNRLQREAYARADELEPRFVRVLEPILNRSADEAATRFARFATDYLTASGAPSARTGDRAALGGMSRAEARGLLASLALTAAAPTPDSCMVCLYPRAAEAEALAEPGAEDPAIMHVTLCYLGEVDPSAAQAVAAALGVVAGTHPPLAGTVGGIASFDDQGNGHPSILLPDVPGLVELRQAVCEAVLASGSDYARDHGYAPHLTVAYRENGPQPPEATSLGAPLHFDAIHVVQGDVVLATLPLTGAPALTAAADPGWLAPAANEVVDVDALVAELRGKTDPVRLAVVRDSMTPVLEGAGLSFDVTNPLAANVLAQSGSQIVNIAETTQLNAMRIIRRSYEEGLSIPDTAKTIRGGMREANTARATLIARTELAGATNGGALASVQIVDGATGQQHFKEWLTSDGARHPRHDHYEGLDHQTRPLHDAFSVGGHPMMFPGDPSGPVGEIANCRCTLVWREKPGEPTNARVDEPAMRVPRDTVSGKSPPSAEVASLAQNVLTRAVMAEPAVTADMRALASANGGELVGLAHKMKAAPSLARKIAADAAEKNLSVAEAAGGINDALRYTAVFEPADYAAAAESTLGGFEARGYQVVKAKNYWERGDAYNGINAVLESPTGQRLELQFHTPASLGAKEDVLHPLYEEFRVGASGARRAELWRRMVDAADGIAFPLRVKTVGTLVRQDA